MAMKNLGTIFSIRQKVSEQEVSESGKTDLTFEKEIRIRLDLNIKADKDKDEKDKEYNIYVINTKEATLISMDQYFRIEKDFEISLNKKYDFELNISNNSIIGLTECSEK